MKKWSSLVVGLAAALMSGSSIAQTITYEAYFPPSTMSVDTNGSMGANTARSFAGAARMAIQAFRGVTPPGEGPLLSSCQANSSAPNYWPESCNPGGMVAALIQGQWGSWISSIYQAWDQSSALGQQINTLKYYRSPNLVPIYGQADHWVMVFRMAVDANSGNILGVVFRDGGPGGDLDSGWNSYDDGQRSSSGASWQSIYYKVITSVGSADPYYNKFALLWDPPPDAPLPAPATYRAVPPRGPVSPGTRLTPGLVQRKAIEALQLGGLDATDAEMWSILSQARPALPDQVHGVYPDGSNWNYYLVPFLNDRQMLVGMAMLDVETAAYQQAWVLPEPRHFARVEHARALALASSHTSLNPDESLDEGILTWDPTADGSISRSPMKPYYEFPVWGPRGEDRGAIAVRLDTGKTLRVGPCQASRRTRSFACSE